MLAEAPDAPELAKVARVPRKFWDYLGIADFPAGELIARITPIRIPLWIQLILSSTDRIRSRYRYVLLLLNSSDPCIEITKQMSARLSSIAGIGNEIRRENGSAEQ